MEDQEGDTATTVTTTARRERRPARRTDRRGRSRAQPAYLESEGEHGDVPVDDRSSFDRALMRLEGRTMRAFGGLREEVLDALEDQRYEWREELRDMSAGFLPTARAAERWRSDAEHFTVLDRDVGALQDSSARTATILPTLATKDDMRALLREQLQEWAAQHPTTLAVQGMIETHVKAASEKLATPEHVASAIQEANAVRWKETQRVVTWILGILTFLYITGLLNLPALFHK